MNTHPALRTLFALLAALVLAFAVAACGDDDDDGDGGDTTAGLIEENPDNNGVAITVGSKNFTEQIILGEIYAQALEAAGYDVSTDLNLGDETGRAEGARGRRGRRLSRVHVDRADLVLRVRSGGRAGRSAAGVRGDTG